MIKTDIKKLKKITKLLNKKIKKNYSSTGYDSSLRGNTSELVEVRNVLKIASKIFPSYRIYFENMYEKAGFSTFHQSDTLNILEQILELCE